MEVSNGLETPNSMTVESYLEASKVTMPKNSTINEDLYHGAVGIATEIYELKKAFTHSNTIEELGDACFYLALMHRRYPFEMFKGRVETDSKAYALEMMYITSMELLDLVKARAQYGRDNIIGIQRACSSIGAYIGLIAKKMGTTPEKVMFVNYMKLQGPGGRFYNGYSDDKANNRDLEQEGKILDENI